MFDRFNMVIKERCDVLRRSTEKRVVQFGRRRRERRKISKKGKFFPSGVHFGAHSDEILRFWRWLSMSIAITEIARLRPIMGA